MTEGAAKTVRGRGFSDVVVGGTVNVRTIFPGVEDGAAM
jgi:hypothetical protein